MSRPTLGLKYVLFGRGIIQTNAQPEANCHYFQNVICTHYTVKIYTYIL